MQSRPQNPNYPCAAKVENERLWNIVFQQGLKGVLRGPEFSRNRVRESG